MPSLPSSSNISVCTVAFDRTFDRIYETEIPSDFVHVHVVGSCNGLLPDTCLRQLMCVTLGFAYQSENDDYKVVRISSSNLYGHEIEV